MADHHTHTVEELLVLAHHHAVALVHVGTATPAQTAVAVIREHITRLDQIAHELEQQADA